MNHQNHEANNNNETRSKIQLALRELLENYKSTDISVKMICAEADIGVGTFYHYYSTKSQAFFDISHPVDLYFKNTVRGELDACEGAHAKLLCFFRQMAEFMMNYVLERGLTELLKTTMEDLNHFLTANRTTRDMLLDIVDDPSLYREKKKHLPNEQIVYHLLCLSRGIIHDWLSNRCSYNLRDTLLSNVEEALTD